jgi:hypothetical protein
MEFKDLPLEQGLQRLLKGWGWIMISARKNDNTLEKVVVVPNNQNVRPLQRQGDPLPESSQEAEGPPAEQAGSGQEAEGSPPAAPARAIGALANLLLRDEDPAAQLKAWQDYVGSVDAEELGRVIEMLQDQNVQPAQWKAALAPLSDTMSSKEWEFIMSALENPASREWAVQWFEQSLLFKTLAEAERR